MISPGQLDQLPHQSRDALIRGLRREPLKADLELLGEMKRARVRGEQRTDSGFEYVECSHLSPPSAHAVLPFERAPSPASCGLFGVRWRNTPVMLKAWQQAP